MRSRLSYLMPCFYGGCIAVQYGWVRALGVEWWQWIMLYLVLGFFLFCSFSHGVAFLILLYPWVSATGWYVHGSFCIFALLCENEKNSLCEVVWLWNDISWYQYIKGYVEYIHVGAYYLVLVVWWYLPMCIHGWRILVWCRSVVAFVFAAGLFYLHKDSLYVFMSRFLCGEAL